MIPELLAACLLFGIARADDPVRIGVFVGHDEGAQGQERLLFATSDARKMRDLFVARGEVEPEHAHLLVQPTRHALEREMEHVHYAVEHLGAEGRSTLLLFYYSGHGDDEGLQLGNTHVPHEAIRAMIEASGADVRVAMFDACQSGAAVRLKGGVRGPARSFSLDARITRGTAILTSSSKYEFSQESQELGGGFFTHYLHAALLGAADVDRDGQVGLMEAYRYVHDETTFRTRSAPGVQTPSYELGLSGAGDVWLTRLDDADARLGFDGGLQGRYTLWDETRRRYVAEVDGSVPAELALPAGHYFVHQRFPGWVDEAELVLERGERRRAEELEYTSVPYERTAARGDLKRQVRRATTPDPNLQLVVGGRAFGRQSVYHTQYLPPYAIGGIEMRLLHRKGPYLSFDALSGSGSGTLHFDLSRAQVIVRSFSTSATAGWTTAPFLFRAGGGGRVQLMVLNRSFPALDLPQQTTVSVSPGIIGWVGLHYRRVNLDLAYALHLLPVRWDDHPPPVFGEAHLTMGYRF